MKTATTQTKSNATLSELLCIMFSIIAKSRYPIEPSIKSNKILFAQNTLHLNAAIGKSS